jgi:prepilin-type N-terminal cleavage/methylation domain-containing protein
MLNKKRLQNFFCLNFLRKNQKGFTLIEVLTAIFIITVGAGGAITLIHQTVGFTQETSSKLVASYLAQEGVEIVKNIRDSNFLKVHKTGIGEWSDGLTGCSSGCQGDYTSNNLSSYSGQKLKVDGSFYNYGSGEDTPFSRKITITPDTNMLKVVVEIFWQGKGRDYIFSAQENLYKWW